ncbi:protein-tyrosine phosphatase domain-containing protein [Ditylenchus destructor]|nr:protein-tyrosine phosphatase domain-containing protein [Ditylenchus destructor]
MALQVLNSKEPLSMPMVIRELRSRRHGSVQTDMQYVFMHRAIINFAENKNLLKEGEVAQFNEKYEEYVKPFGN